jgi:Cys-tRNA synthase (O-phospho-L-seryl-tRNA:Cys-tRNA synthase)
MCAKAKSKDKVVSQSNHGTLPLNCQDGGELRVEARNAVSDWQDRSDVWDGWEEWDGYFIFEF